MIKQEISKDDKFIRNVIESNRLRMVTKERGGKGPIDMQKWGFDKFTATDQQRFDPLRLKILVMPY